MITFLCYIMLFIVPGDRRVGGLSQAEKIYTVSDVSIKPQPMEGLESFNKKWIRSVAYPEDAVKKKVQGMVYIEFVVNRDGTIRDTAVKAGIGFGCDEAALKGFRAVSKLPWKPAVLKDSVVSVRMVLPFYFRIIER